MVFASQEVYVAQLNPILRNKLRIRNSSFARAHRQKWPKWKVWNARQVYCKRSNNNSKHNEKLVEWGCAQFYVKNPLKPLSFVQHCWQRFVQLRWNCLTQNYNMKNVFFSFRSLSLFSQLKSFVNVQRIDDAYCQ